MSRYLYSAVAPPLSSRTGIESGRRTMASPRETAEPDDWGLLSLRTRRRIELRQLTPRCVLADLSTVLHSGSEFEKNPRSKLADFLTACCKFQLGLETFFDPRPPRVMLHSRRATYAGFFGPLFFLWN